jgi:hypothetical protein
MAFTPHSQDHCHCVLFSAHRDIGEESIEALYLVVAVDEHFLRQLERVWWQGVEVCHQLRAYTWTMWTSRLANACSMASARFRRPSQVTSRSPSRSTSTAGRKVRAAGGCTPCRGPGCMPRSRVGVQREGQKKKAVRRFTWVILLLSTLCSSWRSLTARSGNLSPKKGLDLDNDKKRKTHGRV